jgi:hypothetical protein
MLCDLVEVYVLLFLHLLCLVKLRLNELLVVHFDLLLKPTATARTWREEREKERREER